MEENKRRPMETIDKILKSGGEPIAMIFEMPPQEGARYRVIACGKEIERLRSFGIDVSNEPRAGVNEGLFYRVEQYADIREDWW